MKFQIIFSIIFVAAVALLAVVLRDSPPQNSPAIQQSQPQDDSLNSLKIN